jgi:hypothetical protein
MIKPGDIAVALEVLHESAKYIAIAERDYPKHPARDNYDRMVNATRTVHAKERRESIERVMTHLAAALPTHPTENK